MHAKQADARHYRERAMDLASLVLAIGTSRANPDGVLSVLTERQHRQRQDLLHEFAYSGRKALEAAVRLGEEYLPVDFHLIAFLDSSEARPEPDVP